MSTKESMKLNNLEKNSNILVGMYVDNEGLFKHEKDLNNCLYSLTKQMSPVDIAIVYDSNIGEEGLNKLKSIIKSPVLTMMKNDEDGNVTEEKEEISKDDKLNYELIESSKIDNFPKFFNLVFNYADYNEYTFFSIIEQEDVVALNWYDFAEKYANEEEDNSIFLPITRNNVNGSFAGVINEASWVEGMAEEAGVSDMNLLLKFNAINPLGGLFKTEDIKESSEEKDDGYVYPMKESIKITHSYEFFLRMVYDDLKIRTVPRMGYELKIRTDKDSFNHVSCKIPQNLANIDPQKGGMSQEEIQFYIDLSKKEYFFEEDRGIVFDKEKKEAQTQS